VSKHTPGPWEWKKIDNRDAVTFEDGLERHTVFVLGTNSAANARLIAAAPELLRILKEIAFFDSHEGGGHSDLFYDDPDFRREIEAVIAKAEGKS